MNAISHNKTFAYTIYKCSCCNYETTVQPHASRHKTSKKCPESNILKESRLAMDVKDVTEMTADIMAENNISTTDTEIAKLRAEIDDLSAIVKRQKSAIIKLVDNGHFDDDGDCEGSGLIYFVRDTVVTDRGKIGRTKNTDVKKLKSRYSTFGSPRIQCYFSMDIKIDESKLKARLREAGCMQSNTEMVTNCDLAIRIFCEFASEN